MRREKQNKQHEGQIALFDVRLRQTEADRKELVRRVSARLDGKKPRRKFRWVCQNCNHGFWTERAEAVRCGKCKSIRVKGELK